MTWNELILKIPEPNIDKQTLFVRTSLNIQSCGKITFSIDENTFVALLGIYDHPSLASWLKKPNVVESLGNRIFSSKRLTPRVKRSIRKLPNSGYKRTTFLIIDQRVLNELILEPIQAGQTKGNKKQLDEKKRLEQVNMQTEEAYALRLLAGLGGKQNNQEENKPFVPKKLFFDFTKSSSSSSSPSSSSSSSSSNSSIT